MGTMKRMEREIRLDVVGGEGRGKSWISVSKATMANFPLAKVMNWGMHICRLLVEIKHAQKTATTSPALIAVPNEC
jgi:hypothetical protein